MRWEPRAPPAPKGLCPFSRRWEHSPPEAERERAACDGASASVSVSVSAWPLLVVGLRNSTVGEESVVTAAREDGPAEVAGGIGRAAEEQGQREEARRSREVQVPLAEDAAQADALGAAADDERRLGPRGRGEEEEGVGYECWD